MKFAPAESQSCELLQLLLDGFTDEVVDSTHGEDTNQHEPSTEVGEPSCPSLRRQYRDPGILPCSEMS